MRYLLGVDGGNTKTDYLLCTENGDFVDVYRCGTCSHEQMDDSYDGMERIMQEQLDVLLTRNNIRIEDIAAGGFGLAGADLPSQVAELTARIAKIGFRVFAVSNDGILGIKAASQNGTGICVVNGTGTVVIGIDTNGHILQVGGVGGVSGDLAGGGYVMQQVMFHLYAHYYRCGEYSDMFAPAMELLGIQPDDLLVVVGDYNLMHKNMKALIQLADSKAQASDPVAMKILDGMGVTMGHSTAGCIRLLHFDELGLSGDPLPVILVGSLWHKIAYGGMKKAFEKTTMELSRKECCFIPLQAPAAVGGVLWAKELLMNEAAHIDMPDGKYRKNATVTSEYRKQLLDTLTLDRYESLVYGGGSNEH